MCGENKGADQLRGHREADLRLCFRICKKPVFSRHGSIKINCWTILTAKACFIAEILSLCGPCNALLDL